MKRSSLLLLFLASISWADTGVTLYDNSGMASKIHSPAAYSSTYTLVVPDTPGVAGQVLSIGSVSGTTLTGAFTTPAGGGASSLAISKNGVHISSPTAEVNFLGPPFLVTLAAGGTAQVTLDGSSVTLQGNNLSATYLTNSSATATYLQSSSATATYLQLSSASVTYCNANGTNCSASATTLISSGVAFGSSSNAVTQDTTTFRWDNNAKQLIIASSAPLTTINKAGTQTFGIYHSTLPINGGFGPQVSNTFLYGKVDTAGSITGSLSFHVSTSIYSQQSSGNPANNYASFSLHPPPYSTDGEAQISFFNGVSNPVYSFKPSAFSIPYSTASQFVNTDSNNNFVTYDLFGGSPTFTSSIAGTSISIGTMTVVPSGNIGVSIGASASATNAGAMFDLSASTSNGVVIFNNQAQSVGSANNMLSLISTNTAYGGYFMRIWRNDSNSNGDIRTDSPNPNFEFVETDQSNSKFEIGINNGISYWATRNAADNSFERTVEFPSIRSGSPGIIVKSTGALYLEDTVASTIGLKAPNTLGASWTHDLWSTYANAGKVLIQTSDSGARALAWSNTFGVSGSSLTSLAPMLFASTIAVSGSYMALNATAEARFNDLDDSNYVSLRSSNTVASNVTWVLPNTDGASNQAIVTNGASVLNWRSLPKYYRVTIDTTTTGVALGSSTLTIPVLANTTYYYDCFIVFQTTVTTNGVGLAMFAPTGSTVTYTAQIPFAADGAGGEWQGSGTTVDDAIVSTGVAVINTNYAAHIFGNTKINTTPGNLIVRFRAEVAAQTATIMAGSMCTVLENPS